MALLFARELYGLTVDRHRVVEEETAIRLGRYGDGRMHLLRVLAGFFEPLAEIGLGVELQVISGVDDLATGGYSCLGELKPLAVDIERYPSGCVTHDLVEVRAVEVAIADPIAIVFEVRSGAAASQNIGQQKQR